MKALVAVGALTFAAAKFIWDASTERALVWAAIVGGVAYWITLKPAKVENPPTI